MTLSKTNIKKPASPASEGRNVVYGWLPDIPDQRDQLYGAVRQVPAKLPVKVDLRKICSPVEDQKDLGCCTANALAGAFEFLMRKDRAPLVDISRLFIYYNERVIRRSVRTDSGAMLRDGIKTLAELGVCSEKNWPHDVAKFAQKPPQACYREALNYRILSYARLDTLDEMRACLAEGYPFVFGFSVYESFESQQVARTGVLELPRVSEKMLGGHAVLGVGYDDVAERFMVRNSWGTDWGKKGFFTMPYEYMADRNLSDDFWTIRLSENM